MITRFNSKFTPRLITTGVRGMHVPRRILKTCAPLPAIARKRRKLHKIEFHYDDVAVVVIVIDANRKTDSLRVEYRNTCTVSSVTSSYIFKNFRTHNRVRFQCWSIVLEIRPNWSHVRKKDVPRIIGEVLRSSDTTMVMGESDFIDKIRRFFCRTFRCKKMSLKLYDYRSYSGFSGFPSPLEKLLREGKTIDAKCYLNAISDL